MSMHVLITRQLLAKAISLQADGASTGLTLNIGGSGGTNVVSVLQRVK
ncbi:MAG: hypothetical protein ACM3TR_07275 [Caulobacteraceae bacterium]